MIDDWDGVINMQDLLCYKNGEARWLIASDKPVAIAVI